MKYNTNIVSERLEPSPFSTIAIDGGIKTDEQTAFGLL
jgi:hypothetical protein